MNPPRPRALLALFFALLAAGAVHANSVLKISANSTVRAASEVEADYSTTHLFVDEIAGDSIPITIFFDPGTLGVQSAEVFSNLNRRDRAQLDNDGDGQSNASEDLAGTGPLAAASAATTCTDGAAGTGAKVLRSQSNSVTR